MEILKPTLASRTIKLIGWLLTCPHSEGYPSDHLASPIRPVTDWPNHDPGAWDVVVRPE